MSAINGAPSDEQMYLGLWERPVAVRPHLHREIEQKYLFESGFNPGAKIQISHDHTKTWILTSFPGRDSETVEFEGEDYYLNVIRNGRLYIFRHRTGFPINHCLGIKVQYPGDSLVRREIEFLHDSAASDDTILSYLKTIAELGDSFSEHRIRVKGLIRYLYLDRGLNKKIELVACIGANLTTGKAVSTAEIEIHGFTSIEKAKQEIRKYESELNWKPYRTPKNLTALLK